MPQMAPMWWMTLMLMFIMTLMTMISLIFFMKKINLNKDYNIKINELIWKW